MAKRGLYRVSILLATLLWVGSLPSVVPAVEAGTLTVCLSGCEYTTIADALAASRDGDAIDIGEGSYAGGFAIDKRITLRGAGRDKTTIEGTSAASVIRVDKRANVTIEAVTIAGGGGSATGLGARGGGGILNEGGLTLRDSIVRGNAALGGFGGGIFSESSKLLTISNSEVSGNEAADGGGIFLRGSDVTIEDTVIAGNRGTRNGGGISHQGSETLRLERSEIRDNRADLDGGGVLTSSEIVLVDSTVSGNRASNIGGIGGGRERMRLVGSTVSGNISLGSGGGIRVGSGGVSLVESSVEANQSTRANGGGIFANNLSGDISLKDSTVSGNIAAQDGGGILTDSSEVDLDNSKVTDNRAGRLGGGIYARVGKKGLIKVRNGSVITGNLPDQCYPPGLRC